MSDTSPLNYRDDGPGMIAACSLLLTLATVVVGLRFWSKKLTRVGWTLDDWLVLAALGVHHVFMILAFIMIIVGGLGRDIRIVFAEDPNNIVVLFQGFFGAEVCYGFDSTLVKLSVLAFYWRIFPTPTVRWGCYILGTMCILWTIAIEITNFLQCQPLEAFWHIEMQALPTTRCLDTSFYFLINSSINCVIDLATLALPIPDVMKLHTTKKKKWGIAGVFLLGGMAFAASLVRTVTTGIMWQEGNVNFTRQFVIPGGTTIAEIYVAIIGACLPTLVPIYKKLRYGEYNGSSKSYGSGKGFSGASSERPAKKPSRVSTLLQTGHDGSFERLHGDEVPMTDFTSNNSTNYAVNIDSKGTHESYQHDLSHKGSISVRQDRDVEWQRV